MIPQETVQKILDTAQIEEVVGDFVSLRKRGSEYIACCPFHNEKTPSFHINSVKGLYYCFGCHKGGTAVGFVMDYEHMTYVEALRYLAKKYSIEIEEKEESAEDIAKRQRSESLHAVSEYAAGFFKEQLQSAEGRSIGLAYFHSRGLLDETIEKYGLGWAPSGRTTFSSRAAGKGYKEEYLLETGLCALNERDGTLRDRFYERVVFPIHSQSGRVVAFGARTLKSKVEGRSYSKYVNSKESEIYVKNKSLYGLWFAKKDIGDKDKCYLVEGYLDVLSMHQLGIRNVVASSGTSLTEGQIALIKRYTHNVTIMYDGDSAGIHAALRGIDMFLKEDMNVKVVLIPDGDDPDSYSRKHTLEEVESFIRDAERDFIDFKASQLLDGVANDPQKKAAAANDLADTIALIPDAVKRAAYVEFLSGKLGMRQDVLETRVNSTRAKLVPRKRPPAGDLAPGSGEAQGQVGSLAPDIAPQVSPTPAAPLTGLDAMENDRTMGKAERDLMNFILANGTSLLEFQNDSDYFIESAEDRQTVFDFISQALEDDRTVFANRIYRDTFEAYSSLYYDGYGQDEIVKKLMDGENREIAFVAAELSSDEKYDLSISGLKHSMMAKGSWLTRYVPKSVLVFQACRLESRIAELMVSLKAAGEAGEDDNGILLDLMQARRTLKAVKVKLGRERN